MLKVDGRYDLDLAAAVALVAMLFAQEVLSGMFEYVELPMLI